MPLFEYVCEPCGHEFETLVRGGRSPHCPACSSEKLVKKLSRFSAGSQATPAAQLGPGCGTCGDPRGPGACAMD